MNICIIGAGASGSVCAIMLAKNGHKVTIFEKNEKLGKKLYITGKGRCNLTNATTGQEFLNKVVHGQKFVYSSETRFNSTDTMNFFTSLGVPLKIERGNRVFPVSDKSSDIIFAIEKELKRLKVCLKYNSAVTDIITENNMVSGVVVGGEKQPFDAVVVATGGKSYPQTGSTGDGYKFATKTGHNIVEPVPSLVGILTKDMDTICLQGLSLKNVRAKIINNDGKTICQSEIGEMLFTDKGISGPIILSLSAYVARTDLTGAKVIIDFKPALDIVQLENRINREISNLGSKQIGALLEELLPKSLKSVFINRLALVSEMQANQLTKSDRKALANLLKNFDLVVDKLEGFDRAVITSGGVSTKQINPANMQSKLVKNLYFIGEVLDIDALTGGFNLQLAFSTAAACASSIR